MKNDFTDDEIIRFLYDEMTSEESHAFLDALCIDEKLWERYEYFQGMVEQLSHLKYEPSQLSIEKIRSYVHEGEVPEGPVLKEVETSQSKALSSTLSTGKILSVSVNLNAVVLMAVLLFVSVAVTGTFLQLKRGLPGTQRPSTFVQKDTEPQLRWDDSYLDDKLDKIREKVQDLKTVEPTL